MFLFSADGNRHCFKQRSSVLEGASPFSFRELFATDFENWQPRGENVCFGRSARDRARGI